MYICIITVFTKIYLLQSHSIAESQIKQNKYYYMEIVVLKFNEIIYRIIAIIFLYNRFFAIWFFYDCYYTYLLNIFKNRSK